MQGSLEQSSSRERAETLRPEIQDQLPVVDNQAVLEERGMHQTFLNNTSINTDNFKNDLSAVAGFPEGRVLIVTYFSVNQPITDVRSHTTDLIQTIKDQTHISLTQIRNFELRVSSEFSFEYTEETNVSKVTGEGLTFAGFIPHVHDVFLYELRNGKIGIFTISGIQRLALGQDTYHKVTFVLQEFLTSQMRDRLQKQSTVWYFDKTKFLVGNHAMLSTEGFIQQKDLRHLRSEIIQNYIDRFYKRNYSSFIRPDEVYDPYVVEYWNKKVSYNETYLRPLQLLETVDNYKKTIWAVLTTNPIKNLSNITREFKTKKYANTFWGVNTTSLLGRLFLYVGDEGAAQRNPTIDNNSDPILMDSTPVFHSHEFDEAERASTAWMFRKQRRDFYGDQFPEQKCTPSVHYTDRDAYSPEACENCVHTECVYRSYRPDNVDRLQYLKPPFPVLSSEELEQVWRKLKNIEVHAPLTDAQMAELRGYIQWYRTTYPGTLSSKELELEWRKTMSFDDGYELTEDDRKNLKQYIESYRRQFLPVLFNRQLEIIWRMEKGFSFGAQLTEAQQIEVLKYIAHYRRDHGYPPEDMENPEVLNIGSPITTDEVRITGAVMYDDLIVLEGISLQDLADTERPPIAPPDDKNPYSRENMPHLYYPKLRGYHFCPSTCQYHCGARPHKHTSTTTSATTPSYALSSAFYDGSVMMEPFEQLVYDTITCKEVKPEAVENAVSRYLEWSDEDAFYRHLFALYLIDSSLYWLRFHS